MHVQQKGYSGTRVHGNAQRGLEDNSKAAQVAFSLIGQTKVCDSRELDCKSVFGRGGGFFSFTHSFLQHRE